MTNEIERFIDAAEKERKYAPNTAIGFRAALGIFVPELNDQEKESLQTFKDHIENIYMSVYRKNRDLSSKTLLEYKRRILRVLSDFEQYGNDPDKMASWNPARRMVKKGRKKVLEEKTHVVEDNFDDEKRSNVPNVTMNRFELNLRDNVKAIILTPADLTAPEAIKIKKYIEYLEDLSK